MARYSKVPYSIGRYSKVPYSMGRYLMGRYLMGRYLIRRYSIRRYSKGPTQRKAVSDITERADNGLFVSGFHQDFLSEAWAAGTGPQRPTSTKSPTVRNPYAALRAFSVSLRIRFLRPPDRELWVRRNHSPAFSHSKSQIHPARAPVCRALPGNALKALFATPRVSPIKHFLGPSTPSGDRPLHSAPKVSRHRTRCQSGWLRTQGRPSSP